VHYEFVRDGFRSNIGIRCAVCNGNAQHRLTLPATIVNRANGHTVPVPPELRGLCRECGRGRHSFSFLSDEDLERLRLASERVAVRDRR